MHELACMLIQQLLLLRACVRDCPSDRHRAKQIKACGGAWLLTEVHGGARKRTKDDIVAAKAVA
jgi:hypothetical protein